MSGLNSQVKEMRKGKKKNGMEKRGEVREQKRRQRRRKEKEEREEREDQGGLEGGMFP